MGEAEVMYCKCGNSDFKIDLNGETVYCQRCHTGYKLGRHLFSGCASSVGILYLLEQEEDGEFYWYSDKGSCDWRNGKSETEGFGENVG